MSINWYPGHMEKGKRLVEKHIDLVDVVLELVDARLPYSSRNPDIEKITKKRPRVILLNKSDLADPNVTAQWIQWFRQQGDSALAISSTNGENLNRLPNTVAPLAAEALQKWVNKGRLPRSVRLMMVGIPNVGKSSLINRLIGVKKVAAADRPGLTRQSQWVRIRGDMDLLDMPGILMPRIHQVDVGRKLASTGAISDEVYDKGEVARFLILWLTKEYPTVLTQRYDLEGPLSTDGEELLYQIGRKRGYLQSGNRVDSLRTAQMVIDEFRGGKLGRISLEKPADFITEDAIHGK